MARELGLELVEHAADRRLGMRLHLRDRRRVVGPALGIEIDDQRRLQRVGQPGQPLVEVRALRAAQRRREASLRMGVGEVQADRGGLVQHEVAVDQHRDQAVRIQVQVLGALVRLPRAVDQLQRVTARRAPRAACAASCWRCRDSGAARAWEGGREGWRDRHSVSLAERPESRGSDFGMRRRTGDGGWQRPRALHGDGRWWPQPPARRLRRVKESPARPRAPSAASAPAARSRGIVGRNVRSTCHCAASSSRPPYTPHDRPAR